MLGAGMATAIAAIPLAMTDACKEEDSCGPALAVAGVGLLLTVGAVPFMVKSLSAKGTYNARAPADYASTVFRRYNETLADEARNQPLRSLGLGISLRF